MKQKLKRTETETEHIMGFLSSLGNSRYLKKEDANPTPLLLTIAGAKEENVSMEGESQKIKTVLYFQETSKGFVLGKVTGEQIASFLGDPGESPVAWFGKKIVLYCDPNVMMKGKIVGGLRVRQPRNAAQLVTQATHAASAQRQVPTPPPVDPDEDNIPY